MCQTSTRRPVLSNSLIKTKGQFLLQRPSLHKLFFNSPHLNQTKSDRKMDSLWQAISPASPSLRDYNDVEFWLNPERQGWLSKQGEFLKTWRRRWFVLKKGKLLWFRQPEDVNPSSVPRGVVHVGRCQVVKGAEDEIHKEHSFVVYIDGWPTYFVADSDKVKEEWVSSIGRAIVQHSGASTPEIHDYQHLTRP